MLLEADVRTTDASARQTMTTLVNPNSPKLSGDNESQWSMHVIRQWLFKDLVLQ